MHRSLIHKPGLLALAILLLGLSAYSCSLLVANIMASRTKSDIHSWQVKQLIPSQSDFLQSFNHIQSALTLDSNNPNYLETQAHLHRYNALSLRTQHEAASSANRQALMSYRHLLTLRPSWASYWGSIVAIKYDLWEFDDEMVSALQNAARLAPWSTSTQHIVIRAGFHGWPFIDIATRQVINNMLDNAMQLQPKETIRLALNQGFNIRLEPYLRDDELMQKVYAKELKMMKEEGQRGKVKEER